MKARAGEAAGDRAAAGRAAAAREALPASPATASKARPPALLDDGVVRIRLPSLADAIAIYRGVEASRPELEAWMPWCTPTYSLADAEAWILGSVLRWPQGPLCPFVIETMAQDDLVGSCGIDVIEPLDRVHKIGYWVRSDRTGNGIARRAARLAAAFAFEHLGAARIDILVATGNLPSQAVAEAIGARREGVLRSRFLLRGERHDAVVFGLLREYLDGRAGDPRDSARIAASDS